ncbi:MAG TPA: fibronectin type III domain-containing protein [Tepidisphaeraceae bacterium]|nr:fibronectin type III domain-containing protein [Tepidisphaeraceae bacterium]
MTSHVVNDLQAGIDYQFRIRAQRGDGTYSAYAYGGQSTPTLPRPTNVVATSIGGAAAITWSDNSGNETGFHIERRDGASSPWTRIGTVASGVTKFTDHGLPGDAFDYRVRAYRGTYLLSNPSDATTVSVDPAAPTNVTAVPLSGTEVLVRWAGGTSAEDGYTIERSANGGTTFDVVGGVGLGYSVFLDELLTPATNYLYRVRANVGTSASAAAVASQAVQTLSQNTSGLYRVTSVGSVTSNPGALTVSGNLAPAHSGWVAAGSPAGAIFKAVVGSAAVHETGITYVAGRSGAFLPTSSGVVLEDTYARANSDDDFDDHSWPVAVERRTERSAFEKIEAEWFDAATGSHLISSSQLSSGGGIAGNVGGDWVRYDAIDFGAGAASLRANLAVASDYAGKFIQIRLDSPSGLLLGTLRTDDTGSWTGYSLKSAPILPVTGVHSVFLVFQNSATANGSIANVDYFSFSTSAQPAAPESVVGVLVPPHAVELQWNPNADPEVIGYNVYRAVSENGNYRKVNVDSLVATPEFTDYWAPTGATAYYRITAIASDGGATVESAGSSIVPIAIPAVGGASAAYVETDVATSGNWQATYGEQGGRVFGDSSRYARYAEVTPVGGGNVSLWSQSGVTSDARGLYRLDGSERVAARYRNADSLTFDINLTDGLEHELAVYVVDWNRQSLTQTMEILDSSTGDLLDARVVSGFGDGAYVVWRVRGHVQLRVTSAATGTDAMLSGLFFDRISVTDGLAVTGHPTAVEGQPYYLTLDGQGRGITSWTVDWGDSTDPDTVYGSFGKQHVYADGPGGYAVTVTASNGSGELVAAPFQVTVQNAAPIPTISGTGPYSIGVPIELTGAATDLGADLLVFSWSVTKNDVAYASVNSSLLSFMPDGDGDYVATLNVNDGSTIAEVARTIRFRGGIDVTVGAPSDLAVTAVGETSIGLSWIDRADNEVRFEIERSEQGKGLATVWQVVGTTLSHEGVAGAVAFTDFLARFGPDYQYRVRAIAADGGASMYSPIINATPQTTEQLSIAANADWTTFRSRKDSTFGMPEWYLHGGGSIVTETDYSSDWLEVYNQSDLPYNLVGQAFRNATSGLQFTTGIGGAITLATLNLWATQAYDPAIPQDYVTGYGPGAIRNGNTIGWGDASHLLPPPGSSATTVGVYAVYGTSVTEGESNPPAPVAEDAPMSFVTSFEVAAGMQNLSIDVTRFVPNNDNVTFLFVSEVNAPRVRLMSSENHVTMRPQLQVQREILTPTTPVLSLVRSPEEYPAADSVQLVWTAGSRDPRPLTGFVVEESINTGPFVQRTDINAYLGSNGEWIGAVAYSDIEPRNRYSYRVRSYRLDNNYTVYSSTSEVQSVAPKVPPAPGDVVAVASSPSTIDISWLPNPASTTYGYRVYRGATPDFVPSAETLLNQQLLTQTHYADAGLSGSAFYFYKVTAVAAENVESEPVRAIQRPQAPKDLTATGIGTGKIALAWARGTGNATRSFLLYRSRVSTFIPAPESLVATINGSEREYNDVGVSPGATYYYYLVAVDIDGLESIASNLASAIAKAPAVDLNNDGVPDDDLDGDGVPDDDDKDGVPNRDDTDSDNDGIADPVDTDNDNDGTPDDEDNDDDGDGIVDDEDEDGFGGGNSPVGEPDPSPGIPGENGAPAVPTGLSALNQWTSYVSLTWGDASDNESGFVIQQASDAAFTSGVKFFNVPANTRTRSMTDLKPGTAYFFRIKAYNAVGPSAFSQTVIVVTKPSGLKAETNENNGIDLTWDAGGGNAAIVVERQSYSATHYNPSEPMDEFAEIATLTPGQNTYQDSSLDAGLRYAYRIRARHDEAYSPHTAAVYAYVAPAAPTGLSATLASHGRSHWGLFNHQHSTANFNLTWTDQSNNEEHFFVELSADGETWNQYSYNYHYGYGGQWLGANAEHATISHSRADDDQRDLYVRVRAYAGGLYSDPSNVVTLSPPGASTVDLPYVYLTGGGTVAEQAGDPIELTVSRSNYYYGSGVSFDDPLTVQLWDPSGTAAEGDDYPSFPSSVTIPAGESSVKVTVTPTNDGSPERTETAHFAIRGAAGYLAYAHHWGYWGYWSYGHMTIQDDDWVDIDVDSNNTDGFGMPSRAVNDEDLIEDDASRPGKIISLNDDDSDDDGIPDYADGFDRFTDMSTDNAISGEEFVPLVVQFAPGIDYTKARFRFSYDDARPDQVMRTGDGTNEHPYVYQPGEGKLRLWRRPGNAVRQGAAIGAGGDFIEDGGVYAPADLFGWSQSTLYIEATAASTVIGDARIVIEMDPDGDEGPTGFTLTDAVRLTVAFSQTNVDRDRDEDIEFDGSDNTSPAKPYRFWVNSDAGGWSEETGSLGGGAADIGGPADSSTVHIGSDIGTDGDSSKMKEVFRRDLEDFAQIAFRISEAAWTFADTVTISLENTSNPQMSLRLWNSVRVPGSAPGTLSSTAHISNPATADLIMGATHNFLNSDPNSFVKLDASGELVLTRTSFAQHFSTSAVSSTERQSQMMFEGITPGAGDLTFRFLKGVTLLAESDVRLSLHDMSDLYEHHTVAYGFPVGTQGDWSNSGTVFDPKINPVATIPRFDSGHQAAAFATEADYLVYVHGWNMNATSRRSYGDTAYKRLYWQGYQGTMGMFSWPTQVAPNPLFDPGNFNRSEEVAWHSAQGFLNHLIAKQSARQNGGSLTVLAHSMGGIVASEALALAGNQNVADTVILTQAAVSSEFYFGAAISGTELYPAFGGQVGGSNPRFKDLDDAATKLVNFNNEVDYALQLWVTNTNAKPGGHLHGNPVQPGFGGSAYSSTGSGATAAITRTAPGGTAVPLNINIDTYEMFAHGFHAPSYPYVFGAIGAIDAVVGPFHAKVDLRGARYGFTNSRIDHSGQFGHSNLEVGNYWDEVMKQAGLP